jgi:peroxiredoxin Q/BCP
VRRFAVVLAVWAAWVPCGTGCRASTKEVGSTTASSAATAPPPPLDQTWQRDPGRPLSPGEAAPNFDGIAHTGMRVRLASFLDKPAVVYFFSDDRSPEAAAEARGFRNEWLRLSDKTSMVFGVSGADRILHRDFATAEELPFLLVSDEKHDIAKAFGVPFENGREKPMCFLVGKDGKVLHVLSDVAPDAMAANVLRELGVP